MPAPTWDDLSAAVEKVKEAAAADNIAAVQQAVTALDTVVEGMKPPPTSGTTSSGTVSSGTTSGTTSGVVSGGTQTSGSRT
jgi:hypothetical protein